jgi:hypothetical protein
LFSIRSYPLPDNALLDKYRKSGGYTDCYITEISREISHAQYVYAFYTSFVFKLERSILKWTVSKPSTDIQAGQLAKGSTDEFAAWTVEARTENQLLLSDYLGRTKSWLMVMPLEKRTCLYFGTAIVPRVHAEAGLSTIGTGFHALLGFHKIYSIALLWAAKSLLESSPGTIF